MQDLNDKVTGNTLTAAEWNEIPSEIQNAITNSGQTLSSGDLTQLGKAIGSIAFDNKAAAVLVAPINNKSYFIGGTDGGWFKGVTGGSGYSDNGGSYCGTQFIPTGGDGSAGYLRVDGGYNVGLPYNAAWFGASGSASVAVNTSSIQAAIDHAATVNGRLIGEDGENYGISSLRIKNGLREFNFRSSIITPDSSTGGVTTGALQLDGATQFAGTDVEDCYVSVEMDMQNGGRTAIYADGCKNCTFENNKIYGFTNHATINHYGILFWEDSNYNSVINNYITGFDTPTQRGLLIDFLGAGDAYANYFTGTTTRASTPCTGNIITGNKLLDGSYAINLIGVENSIVSGNYCNNQDHRSIYMAESSAYNDISNNVLTDFLSTAVLLGYGCIYNTVSNNICKREAGVQAAGTGEAVINLNTGATNNTIIGNYCEADTNYGIYMGCDMINNTVENNRIRGYYVAGIALENDWESSLPTNSFYSKPNYAAPPTGSAWSFNDSTGNVIQNNKIYEAAAGRNVCAIYVAEISATGATSTTNNTISDNKVLSPDQLSYNLFIYAETEANLSGLKIKGNTFNSGNSCASYTTTGATTWNDKIDYWEGNEQLDELLIDEFIDFADADLTPSVSTNTNPNTDRYFQFNNTGATSVTDFDDGYNGQTIHLRGDGNTTIVYTSGLIRPTGLVNVTGMNANSIISFKHISGIWYETFRNF